MPRLLSAAEIAAEDAARAALHAAPKGQTARRLEFERLCAAEERRIARRASNAPGGCNHPATGRLKNFP